MTQFGYTSASYSPARKRIEEAGRRYLEAQAKRREPHKPRRPKLSIWDVSTRIDRAIRAICLEYRISYADLIGVDRHRPLPQARSDVFAWMKANTSLSQNQIGHRLNRNHSSVSHALAKRAKK